MDWDTIKFFWNLALTVILALLAWIWKGFDKRIEDIDMRHTRGISHAIEHYTKALEATTNAHIKMQETITNIQIHYVHKDDLKSMRQELLDRFDRLEDLVNKKT